MQSITIAISNETIWVHNKPGKISFLDVQKAIINANKVKHPMAKKIAWENVYQLSREYQKHNK